MHFYECGVGSPGPRPSALEHCSPSVRTRIPQVHLLACGCNYTFISSGDTEVLWHGMAGSLKVRCLRSPSTATPTSAQNSLMGRFLIPLLQQKLAAWTKGRPPPLQPADDPPERPRPPNATFKACCFFYRPRFNRVVLRASPAYMH